MTSLTPHSYLCHQEEKVRTHLSLTGELSGDYSLNSQNNKHQQIACSHISLSPSFVNICTPRGISVLEHCLTRMDH